MRIATYIIAALALGLTSYQQFEINKLKSELETKIFEVELKTHKALALSMDYTREETHSLQDSLEERIGTLEREVEDLKYILGGRNGKR